jgi:hypothetical protein
LASFWHTVPYHPPAHVHTKPLPGADTSAHVPCPLQSCPSQPSMSAQLSPSPKKPAVHAHSNEPSVSVHDALLSHGLDVLTVTLLYLKSTTKLFVFS